MSFSVKQFRQALQDSSKLAQRLEKYLQDCRKLKMDVMYLFVEELYKIINEKQPPILKVNALFALHLLMQTCQYPVIQMCEAFLLPVIQEIALYQSDKRSYPKTSQFFKEKGYAGSIQNLDQLSHNYVTLATKIVFQGAAIKENYYFYTDKLSTPSAFKVLAKKLALKKVEVETFGPDWSQKYEKNLIKFSTNQQYETAYLNLFKSKVERYLVQGGKARQTLDFRKLMKNGDSWLTSELLGCLNQAIEDDNFSVRRLAIGLLNELFISGDIEAVMIVNEGQAVERVFERVMEIKGSSDISRGAQIYPQIPGQLQAKKNFYIQFLKCLQLWAKLVPDAIYLNQEQESRMAKLYQKLKQKNFIFPTNDMIARYSKDFEENMKKNKERNNYMIQTLNEGQSERNRSIASNRISKYSQKISLIKEMRESTILTLPQIEKLIEETEQTIKLLPAQEREISKNMKTLKYFAEQFEKKFELIEESVSQSRLQSMYLRGLKCLQKIEQINSYYEEYKNANIDFKKFADSIAQKCSQIDKSRAKVSDILSKLSKSKEIMSRSRSKLELSHSLHAVRVKEQEYNKPDIVLQKSANGQRDYINQTKTITNLSNLEEDPKSYTNKMKSNYSRRQQIKSKISMDKSPSQSVVSQSQEEKMVKNELKEKNETAKFIIYNEYELTPTKSKRQSLNEEISKHSNSGEGIKNEISNQYSKSSKKQSGRSKISHQGSNMPSGHFNQYKPSSKKKEQFSEGSNWSQQESSQKLKDSSQKQKESSAVKNNKEKSSFKQAFNKNASQNQNIVDKPSKSREIFSESSFSHYDDQNQEMRQAIDKSDNPDFKMLFREKDGEQKSKMSKVSKNIPSHEHYMAVLQSLTHKSNEPQDISRFSKDKSTSQLPPKSNFDNSSRFDSQKVLRNATYSSKSKNDQILQNDYVVDDKRNSVNQRKSSKNNRIVLRGQKGSMVSQNKSSSRISSNKSESNIKDKKKMSSHIEQEQNSMYPYYNNQINEFNLNHPKIEDELVKSKSIRSSEQSRKQESNYSVSIKEKEYDTQNQYFYRPVIDKKQPALTIPTATSLEVLKTEKLKEIQDLQAKIESLKQEQRKLHVVRSEWQTPTRPETIRTAISPRFRNNASSDYINSFESLKRLEEQTNMKHRQQFLREHKDKEMNFDMVQLFKPPEGKLIYKRLYKRDLAQLNIRQKRKILKNKDLVFRNEDIEVGLMIHKDQKQLKIVYYVTSNVFLKTFLFRIEPSSKMPKTAIHIIPSSLQNLKPRKQYRIYLFAEVLQFPYKMPVLEFKYHPQLLSLQENLFLSNDSNYFTSIVPFFFTKFLTVYAVTAQQMENEWTFENVLRSQQTLYSKKILPKPFYILQYFPECINIESKQYESVYAMECKYGSTRFLLRIVIKINRFMYIQGLLTSYKDRQNSQKLMQFAICCMIGLFAREEQRAK